MRSFVQYIVEEERDLNVSPGQWRKRTPRELEEIVNDIVDVSDPSLVDVLIASDIIPKPAPEGFDPQLWYQLQIWGIFDQTVDNTPEEEPEEVEPTPIEDGGGTNDHPLRYFLVDPDDGDPYHKFTNEPPTGLPNDPHSATQTESFQHTSNSPFTPPDQYVDPEEYGLPPGGNWGDLIGVPSIRANTLNQFYGQDETPFATHEQRDRMTDYMQLVYEWIRRYRMGNLGSTPELNQLYFDYAMDNYVNDPDSIHNPWGPARRFPDGMSNETRERYRRRQETDAAGCPPQGCE